MDPITRIYLTLQTSLSAEVTTLKKLGAEWDAQRWYVPTGRDPSAFARWSPERARGLPPRRGERLRRKLSRFGRDQAAANLLAMAALLGGGRSLQIGLQYNARANAPSAEVTRSFDKMVASRDRGRLPAFQTELRMKKGVRYFGSPSRVPNPRGWGSWVSDSAGVLSDRSKARIDRAVDVLRVETGAEIAVVTVGDVSGTPKAFATRLFNYWRVGSARAHNGVLILVVMDQRRIEIEIGRGLNRPFQSGGWLLYMQQSRMIPKFKRGDYAGGIDAGVEALVSKLQRLSPEAMSRDVERQQLLEVRSWAGAAASAAAGSVAVGVAQERTKPKCSRCGKRMQRGGAWSAEEEEMEAAIMWSQLSDEMKLEARIGSVEYSMHSCVTPDCMLHRADFTRADGWGGVWEERLAELVCAQETVGIRARPVLRSGYSDCPKCRRRTRIEETRVVRAATETSTGLERTASKCVNCGDRHERTRILPKVTPYVESSSSSSDSGFGGGSSDGGGCGSSW